MHGCVQTSACLFICCHECFSLRLTREDDVGDNDVTVTYMRIELRHNDATTEARDVENMWSVFLPFLRDVEQLLANFQGTNTH